MLTTDLVDLHASVPALDAQQTLRPWIGAADRHPAMVYLARLAPSGRRSQGSALEQIAHLLSSERLGWQELPWHLVRYQHAAAVRSWLADHRAPSTANTYRSALRGVMRECWRLGYLAYDELARILQVESVRGSRLLRGRALSRGELVAIFGHLLGQDAAAARRDAALVALLYASGGVRRTEASSLQLGDLNRGTGRMVVRGKGNKEREVWLTDEALQAVEDWIQVRGEEPGALLLPVEKDRRSVRHHEPGGSPSRLCESTVRLACRRRAAQAGLSAFSPHDLRRTSISDLLDLTGDLALVSELAGHANPATTKRYDRRPAENRRRAARSLHVPYQRRASPPSTFAVPTELAGDPVMRTHETDYPTLTRWLGKASPGHLWRTWLATDVRSDVNRPTDADMYLQPLEAMAAAIEAAAPAGLAAFLRDSFRDPDEANVSATRLEIACAASLAAARVPFRFGGVGQPDFALTVAEAEAFLEVTREAVDDFLKLRAAVDRRLLEDGLDVQVTYQMEDWPLRVRARNALQTRIVDAAHRAVTEGGPVRTSLDELEPRASAECRMRQPGEMRASYIQHSLEPAPAYLADLASKLHLVLEEKGGQSRRGKWSPNTMLLIDISAAQQALLLGEDGLRAWFNAIEFGWEEVPFSAIAVGFTNWHGVGLAGLYRMRPGVIAAQAEVMTIAAAKLGLKSAAAG